jgi:hypothetical protein
VVTQLTAAEHTQVSAWLLFVSQYNLLFSFINKLLKGQIINRIWNQILCVSIEEKTNACRFLVGKTKVSKLLARLNVESWMLLKVVLKKWDERVWPGFMWLRRGTSGYLLFV